MTDNLEERKAQLMGFMDGELSPEEMGRVNDALMRDAALREEYDGLCRACGKLERLHFEMPDEEALKRIWKSPFTGAASKFAWALIVGGAAVLLGYLVYALLFIEDDEPMLRFAVTGVCVGFSILLAMKIRERITMYSRDPYKDIEK